MKKQLTQILILFLPLLALGCASGGSSPGPFRLADGSPIPSGADFERAKVIDKVFPNYRSELREKHITGEVALQVTIDEQGKVTDMRVLKGDHQALVEITQEAVRQWTFEPARLDGRPVAVLYNVMQRFSLKR